MEELKELQESSRHGSRKMVAFGMLLWVLAALALIAAWIAEASPKDQYLGLGKDHWFIDSIALSLLAIGVKLGVIIKHIHMGMK